jgi:hypothetical protein
MCHLSHYFGTSTSDTVRDKGASDLNRAGGVATCDCRRESCSDGSGEGLHGSLDGFHIRKSRKQAHPAMEHSTSGFGFVISHACGLLMSVSEIFALSISTISTTHIRLLLWTVFVEPQFSGKYYTYYNSRYRQDRLCGLVVRVPGCRSRGLSSIPAATRFYGRNGSGTGSTLRREYSWGTIWKKK